LLELVEAKNLFGFQEVAWVSIRSLWYHVVPMIMEDFGSNEDDCWLQ
jgi:hypothetical protein